MNPYPAKLIINSEKVVAENSNKLEKNDRKLTFKNIEKL